MYILNFKFPGVFADLLVIETTTLSRFYPTAFIGLSLTHPVLEEDREWPKG